MATKILGFDGLSHLITELKKYFVKSEPDKGLSTNDYTTEDKQKLAGLSNYELPTASAEVKGGVKIGERLTMAEDTLSADPAKWADITDKPEKFAPDTHTHKAAEVTDLDDTMGTKIEAVLGEKDYQTADDVEQTLTEKDYQNSTQVEEAITGKGYQTAADVAAAIAGSTHLSREIVEELPGIDTAKENVVYMVKKKDGGSGQDVYDEYLYIAESQSFEHIGSTDVDLSGYVKTEDLVEITTGEIDEMLSA